MNLPGKKYIYRTLSVIFILLVWKLGSVWLKNNLILPSPENTFAAFVRLLESASFYKALGFTLLRGAAGMILAIVLATLLGTWAGMNAAFHAFLEPILVIVRSTPVISFILLALIWMGPENVPVFISLLTMFPLICTGIISGIRNTDKELVDMAHVYGVRRLRMIRGLYFPSLMPYLFNGLSNAMGFGWRAVIIGEVLSQPRWGLGTEMQLAQTYLLVSNVISWTIVAVLLGYLFEWLLQRIMAYTMKWKEVEVQ